MAPGDRRVGESFGVEIPINHICSDLKYITTYGPPENTADGKRRKGIADSPILRKCAIYPSCIYSRKSEGEPTALTHAPRTDRPSVFPPPILAR